MTSPQGFDPYYEWLAIPPAEQPPNLYRLLGLQTHEPNPEVIEFAADRQMLFLRGFRSSPRWPYAEALLNAVARAKIELLDPRRKQAYDQSLLQAEQRRLNHPAPLVQSPTEFQLVPTRETQPGMTAANSPAAIALAEIAAAAMPKTATPAATATATAAKTPAAPGPRRHSPSASSRNWVRVAGIILGGPTGIAIGIWLTHLLGIDFVGTATKPKPKPATTTTTAQPPRPVDLPQYGRAPASTSYIPSSVPASQPAIKPAPSVAKEERSSSPVSIEKSVHSEAKPAAAAVAIGPVLPANVELPPTTSSAAATLFAIAENAVPAEWSLASGTAVPAGGGTYLMRRANNDPQRWNILFLPEGASSDQGIPIAKLLTHAGSVQFRWTTATGDEAYQAPLLNCLLKAGSGPQARTIQLRRPLQQPPLALDLDQDDTSSEFELANSPPPEHLLLEVTTLPQGGAFENGTATAKPGKSVAIQFAELPGAEISLRLQQKGTEEGKFTLRATPEFVEGPRLRFDLTRPKLAEMTKRWTEMGQKAALTIKQTQGRIAALQEQLEDLEGVSGNIAVMTERTRQMKAVNDRMKIEVERLPTHRKRLLEAETRLKAVPTVEKFLASHDQALISFRIVAQAGQDEVVLVEGK